MDNPGIYDLGDRSITAALTDQVITSATDETGATVGYIGRLTDMGSVTLFAEFVYGGGGATCIVVVETSLNQGDDWIEIARFDFAAANRVVRCTVSGAVALSVAANAALGAEGTRNILGDRLRAKVTSTGTYSANTSVSVRAVVRAAGSASGDVTITGVATEAKQDAANTLLTAISGFVDGLEGKDFATQTTLAALLAKVIAAPATEAKQDAANTLLTSIAGYVDGLEGKDFATQTTLAAILALLPAALTGSGNLKVAVQELVALASGSAVIGKVDHSTTGIGQGVKTVTSAGTDEALAGSTPAKWVTIQAQTDNTGKIAVGASGVDATVATGTGVLLSAGDVLTVPVDNLADIYIDATVNGDGVRYTYGT